MQDIRYPPFLQRPNPTHWLQKQLVGHWIFGWEAGQQIPDLGRAHEHGTSFTNGTAFPLLEDGGLVFDETEQQAVQVGRGPGNDFDPDTQITIYCRFKRPFTGFPGQWESYCKYGPNNAPAFAAFSLQKIDFDDSNAGLNIAANGTNTFVSTGTGAIQENVIHDLLGTYDGAEQVIYLDGVEYARSTARTGPITPSQIGDPGLIWGSSALLFHWFPGTLYEGRYWHRALTASEVREFYLDRHADYVWPQRLWHIPAGTGGISLTPAALPVPIALPAPSLAFGVLNLAPDPLAVPITLPAPTLTTAIELQPTPVNLPVALPAPAIGLGALALTPNALSLPVALPVPMLNLGVLALTPDAIQIPLTLPTPALQEGVLPLNPTPAAVPIALPTPTLNTGVINLVPEALPVPLTLPTPTIDLAPVELQPTAVSISLLLPAPLLQQGVVPLNPTPVLSTLTLPTPTIGLGFRPLTPLALPLTISPLAPVIGLGEYRLTPLPTVVPTVLPAPVMTLGPLPIVPSPLPLSLQLPAPVVTGGQIIPLRFSTGIVYGPSRTGRVHSAAPTGTTKGV